MRSDRPLRLVLLLALMLSSPSRAARSAWTQVPCYASKGILFVGVLGAALTVGAATEGLISKCDQPDGVKHPSGEENRCADAEENLSTATTIGLWSLGILGTGGLLHLAFSCSDPVR